MRKSLLKTLLAAAGLFLWAFPSSAREKVIGDDGTIQGYFRVQSQLGVNDNNGYVEVRGPLTTAPDQPLEAARTEAGTVMRLRAFPDTDPETGKLRYKIGNLSSQGIEVFGAPKADYWTALIDEIAAGINTDDMEYTMYRMQRNIREVGYISSARVFIQSLFQIVAGRLDKDAPAVKAEAQKNGITTYDPMTDASLEDFAIRFNKEVSAEIDLHAYLEPVNGNGEDGKFRLYFHWINCSKVSEFYHKNAANEAAFNLGFECMRRYMKGNATIGATGEGIEPYEAQLFADWGYTSFAEKYADKMIPSGIYALSYEDIFSDHELLYNWLKMYVIRFCDPETDDIIISSLNLHDLALEMQKHELTSNFVEYMPSMQENQKLYLTSGRYLNGNTLSTVGTASDGEQRFGLLDSSLVNSAADAAVWNVIPMDVTDNYFAIVPAGSRVNSPGHDDTHYLAMYVDFPMEALHGDILTFQTFNDGEQIHSVTLDNLGTVEYFNAPIQAITSVPRATIVMAKSPSDNETDNIVRIPYLAQSNDYDPSVEPPKPGGFPVGDDEVGVQHAPRRASEGDAKTAQSYGVFFATPVSEKSLNGLWDINADLTNNSVFDLKTHDTWSPVSNQPMKQPWFSPETETIPANHAFMITDKATNELALDEPADEDIIPSGIENVMAERMQENVLYDLKGRRATEALPGHVYILNGKKIIVK